MGKIASSNLATIIGFAAIFAILFYARVDFDTRIQDRVDENHALVCRLNFIFGLDIEPRNSVFDGLRPAQRKALHELQTACPEAHIGR